MHVMRMICGSIVYCGMIDDVVLEGAADRRIVLFNLHNTLDDLLSIVAAGRERE